MKHALVTGASSGIGRSITTHLAEEGHRVLAASRSMRRLEDAFRDLENIELAEVDVTDTRQLEKAVADQPFDIVVANAGVCIQAEIDEAGAASVWRETMALNLDAVFHTLRLTQARIPDGGSFVAISSGLGKQGRPGYAAYSASKHAVLGLVRSAALELANRGIRVNAVCPGWVDTPMSRADLQTTATRADQNADELRRQIIDSLPLGRPVQPDEVAKLVLWLASDSAAAITGQSYNISCGEFSL